MAPPRNDPNAPLTKLCLAIEEHRRTPEGRVKTSAQFLAHFFTAHELTPSDRVFLHLPKDVRGPVISAWGIRGTKAALRDTDEKVTSVVSDAIVATDLSAGAFEDGLSAAITIAWVPLTDWWAFWRAGVLSKAALSKALVTGYELGLFDAAWLFASLESKTAKGTDVVAEGLSKEDLAAWLRRVWESRDGTEKGLLDAIGWEKLIAKTNLDSLIGLADALAQKVGLTAAAEAAERTDPPEAPAEAPAAIPAAALAPAKVPALAAEITKKPSAAPPPASDFDETGPYAVPTSTRPAASKPVDVSASSFDEDETDETRRIKRTAESGSRIAVTKPGR